MRDNDKGEREKKLTTLLQNNYYKISTLNLARYSKLVNHYYKITNLWVSKIVYNPCCLMEKLTSDNCGLML